MYISYERMAELVDAIVCQTIILMMCGFESRYECTAPNKLGAFYMLYNP